MNKLVRKNKKGFTLTEMIVVIAIIGILAAVLIPSVIGYIKNAQKSAALQEATAVLDVYETFETESEAGLLSNPYFEEYYKDIVEKEVPTNVYLEYSEPDERGNPDAVVALILIDGKVIVRIDKSNKDVTYPKTSEILEASDLTDTKYAELKDAMNTDLGAENREAAKEAKKYYDLFKSEQLTEPGKLYSCTIGGVEYYCYQHTNGVVVFIEDETGNISFGDSLPNGIVDVIENQ